MADDERNALVVQGSRSLAEVGTGARRILSTVVSDALAVARLRETALTVPRFRIGRYEFREPDYSQILTWAKALAIEPEDFVGRLNIDPYHVKTPPLEDQFRIEDGHIVYLKLNGRQFNMAKLTYLDMNLPLLRDLTVQGMESIKFIDLSHVPNVTGLIFSSNGLESIDLSKLPKLTHLWCPSNRITELDLYGVPNLTELVCFDNPIPILNLSHVPKLRWLFIGSKELLRLDTSGVPKLKILNVSYSELRELSLINVPELEELRCKQTKLTELELSGVPELTELDCKNNQLTELDLSHLTKLTSLDCCGNSITELDVTANTALEYLYCDPSVSVKKLPSQKFIIDE
jgi:Leucine-rich repeat (LRR) protein